MLFFVVFPAVVEIVPFLVAGKAAVGVEEFGAFVEIVPLFSECLRAGAQCNRDGCEGEEIFFHMSVAEASVEVGDDEVGDFVDGEQGRVESEVVGGGIAPAAVGVEVVVVGAEFVGALGQAACGGGVFCVEARDDSADTFVHRGVHEYADHVGEVAQHIVGASSHYDTWALVGDMADEIALGAVD